MNDAINKEDLFNALDRFVPRWQDARMSIPSAVNQAAAELFMCGKLPLHDRYTKAVFQAAKQLRDHGALVYEAVAQTDE